MRLKDALDVGLRARIFSDKTGSYVAIDGDSWVSYISDGNRGLHRYHFDIESTVDEQGGLDTEPEKRRIDEQADARIGLSGLVLPVVRDITREDQRRRGVEK